jgi:hypothetical protein
VAARRVGEGRTPMSQPSFQAVLPSRLPEPSFPAGRQSCLSQLCLESSIEELHCRAAFPSCPSKPCCRAALPSSPSKLSFSAMLESSIEELDCRAVFSRRCRRAPLRGCIAELSFPSWPSNSCCRAVFPSWGRHIRHRGAAAGDVPKPPSSARPGSLESGQGLATGTSRQANPFRRCRESPPMGPAHGVVHAPRNPGILVIEQEWRRG